MEIRVAKAVTFFGLALVVGIMGAAGVGTWVGSKISVGGPVYEKVIQGKDLVADILPPPAYIIESYLEATLALAGARPLATVKERIGALHKEYDERLSYWRKSSLPGPIVLKLAEKSDAPVQKFWVNVENRLLPAMEHNDKDAAEAAYRDLTVAYNEHRTIVEEIVGDANALNTAIEAEAASQSKWTLIIMAGLITGLLAVLVGGIAAINRIVVKPIIGITEVMKVMSSGDMNVEIPGADSKNEIGTMAQALEVLRDAAIERTRLDAEHAESARLALLEKAERDRLALEEKAEVEQRAAAERDAAMAKVMAEFDAAVGGIAKAAMAGDFSQRVSLEGKEGVIRNLAEAMNLMCENIGDVMNDLVAMMGSLADGDLTKRISTSYEGTFGILKESANTTAIRLSETVAEITASAREVANAAAEISTSTTDLSQRTEEQAAGLEETSASMEEISSTVRKNAENAQQANQLTASAREVADRGGAVVASTVEAMSRIEGSSGKIADIIGVIDEIARQTNLLALNAAVEAARAGDAGRGFAVVASEVRSLAQRSSQAAKDIKDLITSSSAQVRDGVDLVNRTGTSLGEIVSSIQQVANIVADIASASNEQAIGIDQVNKALTQMDEVTQQNSALVEENAATAKTLESQSAAMSERVSFFRIEQGKQNIARAPTVRSTSVKTSAVRRGGPVGRMGSVVC
jgi:methyl-accepting chemotaxis protein